MAGLFLGTLLIISSAGAGLAVTFDHVTYWTGNGWPNTNQQFPCPSPDSVPAGTTMRWNFTNSNATAAEFFYPGHTATMSQHGGGAWFVDVPFFNPTGLAASSSTGPGDVGVNWNGSGANGDGTVTLSGCNEGTQSTATPEVTATPAATATPVVTATPAATATPGGGGGGAGGGPTPTPTKPPTSVAEQPMSGNSGGTVLAIILLAAAGLGFLATSRVRIPKIR